MQILAATDFSIRSQRALRRAGLLAEACGAELALVHVVDDDQPPDLVAIETREADRILAEQISAMAELRGVRCRPMVVAGDAFDGILRTAAAVQADLVVMGAHRKQLLRDIFVGTTLERVIRTGPHPVLMVNTEVAQPYRMALAAVDRSEPSANAVKTSMALGMLGTARLTLVHAFFPLAKGKLSLAGVSQANIDEYVAGERLRATKELITFLDATGLGDHAHSMRIEEGAPFEVISSTVQRLRPDLLVIDAQPVRHRQNAPGQRGRRAVAIARRRYPHRPTHPVTSRVHHRTHPCRTPKLDSYEEESATAPILWMRLRAGPTRS